MRIVPWGLYLVVAGVIVGLCVFFVREIIYRYNRQRARELAARLKLLRGRLQSTPELLRQSCPNVQASVRYVRHYIRRWHKNPGVILFRTTIELLSSAERDIFLLEAKQDPFKGKKGLHFRTYVSPVDGARNSYSIRVPLAYDGSPTPLLVYLHGFQPRRNPYQCQTPPAVEDSADGNPPIVVSPSARGSYSFKGLSEVEVLNTIADVKKHYNIDESRIYLLGHSMGGTGVWSLAVHYPQLFAAISPSSGNTDHTVWEEEWEQPEEQTPRTAFRKRLEDSQSAITYACNLSNLPVLCLHGSADEIVSVKHSRRMVAAVRESSGRVVYEESRRGHWIEDFDRRARWLLTHRLDPYPRRVTLKAAQLKYARAYYAEINAFQSPLELASLQVDASDNPVVVLTQNVAEFTLHEPAKLVSRDLTVVVDGKRVWTGKPPAKLRLRRAGEGWEESSEPQGLRKRADLDGPAGDVQFAPFLVVAGTQDKTERGVVLRAEVESFCTSWQARYGSLPRRKPDTDVSDSDIASYNLILYGGPDENLVTRKIVSNLPCSFGAGQITLFGKSYKGEDLGLRLCYPNPLAPKRLILLTAATSGQGYFQASFRFGNWFDWNAYDNYAFYDYILYDSLSYGPETILLFGYFDSAWQFDERYAFHGLEDYRKRVKKFVYPKPGLPTADRVLLDNVLPEKTILTSGVLTLGTVDEDGTSVCDRGGVCGEGGLTVRADSRLVYRIGKQFKSFSALLTVGTPVLAMERYSRAIFSVYGDGKLLVRTPPLGYCPRGYRIQADVTGVDRLELRVEPASSRPWFIGFCEWGEPVLRR